MSGTAATTLPVAVALRWMYPPDWKVIPGLATQVAGPLVVSFLVQRTGGFGGALLLACGVLVASAAALLPPLREKERR